MVHLFAAGVCGGVGGGWTCGCREMRALIEEEGCNQPQKRYASLSFWSKIDSSIPFTSSLSQGSLEVMERARTAKVQTQNNLRLWVYPKLCPTCLGAQIANGNRSDFKSQSTSETSNQSRLQICGKQLKSQCFESLRFQIASGLDLNR